MNQIKTGRFIAEMRKRQNLTQREFADMSDKEILLSNRMLSTYINTLADNGFIIEKLAEETAREKAMASDSDFGRKALMLPTVFVIRARKL